MVRYRNKSRRSSRPRTLYRLRVGILTGYRLVNPRPLLKTGWIRIIHRPLPLRATLMRRVKTRFRRLPLLLSSNPNLDLGSGARHNGMKR